MRTPKPTFTLDIRNGDVSNLRGKAVKNACTNSLTCEHLFDRTFCLSSTSLHNTLFGLVELSLSDFVIGHAH